MKWVKGLGKTLKWTLILGALLIVVVVIAALIGLGNAGNKSEKSSHQVGPAKYQQVHRGMTKPRVRSLLGKPESTNETTVQGLTSECWYYGVLASSGSYQFCFSNGRLNIKSRF